ncbi:MAG: GAF domain-containing protein [Salinivirgaceae bacterium]
MSRFTDMFKIRRSIRRKMLFSIFLSFILILGAMLSYIAIKIEKLALNNAKELVHSYASGYAVSVQDQLNAHMGMARSFGQALHSIPDHGIKQTMELQKDMMFRITERNDPFLATWIIWERRFFDSAWTLPYGRGRYTVYRAPSGLKYRSELLDNEGDKVNGAYYKMKVSKEETIMNPYTFSYSGNEDDQILETSICIPILKDDEFVGLSGMDVSLESYQEVINDIQPIEGSQLFLIANDGTFVTHPDEDNLGRPFVEVYEEFADTLDIMKTISVGDLLSFQFGQEKSTYYVFQPVRIGNTNTPWSILMKAPLDNIMREARNNLLFTLLVGFGGLILLIVVVYIISGYITRPVKYTTRVLQKLAKGDLENTTKLHVTSGDELQEMSDSMNTLMDGLRHTADFARNIGEGELDVEYQLLSDRDTLGHALLDMQNSLKNARKQQIEREKVEKQQNWVTEGLAKFGDILRKNNENLNQLSFQIMKNLVDYTKANQGCIYVRSENESKELYELKSAIAYDRKKMLKDSIAPGDGLVGRVVHEKLTIYITDVPEDYVHITSGLGKANPRSILIVPLILNDDVFGALELVSFSTFDKYEIEFVEKIAESIASTVSSVKVTERTNKLLEESREQREVLSSQEEEMRQNLEELEATQEEADRRDAEMQALIQALGSSVLITEFDLDGKIQNVNQKCVHLLGIQQNKMVGKHHKSMGLDNTTTPTAYKKFWVDLQNGRTKKRISEVNIAGKVKYIDENYVPLKDSEGNIHKIVAIGYDFTKIKERETEIERLKEELDNLKNS